MGTTVNGVPITPVTELNDSSYDAVIVITIPDVTPPSALEDFIIAAVERDRGMEKVVSVLHCPRVSGDRLVVSPTGPITEYHDVRSIAEATKKGVERAIQAGAKRPVLMLKPDPRFKGSELVALLAALEALYVPLQIREWYPSRGAPLAALGVCAEGGARAELPRLVKQAAALETALAAARDIGGGDPERMAPPRVAEYVSELFKGTSVSVKIIDDVKTFEREYPLYAAVNRAADTVERHRGRIIFLEYNPGAHSKTVMLVGKGVTYDTGGCDIKAGGAMAGMSRDKCGAAAVAGFLKACDLLKPSIKVLAALAVVRNSVGEDAYVADELITCRQGLTVRVGNTDAEGRMAMADLLSEMREKASREVNPHLYTVATLTGHAHRTAGDGYSIVMDNHVARPQNHASCLKQAGETLGDMVEVSTIRREDLAAHRGRAPGDDVLQAANMPSVACARGHQGPAAFLLMTSGLDKGTIPYSHLDIAASGGSLPDPPTGAPILALANLYGLVTL